MTKEEARAEIQREFMERYDQWMVDRFELDDHDYGWKYGWTKSEKLMTLKDSIKAVTMFQKYIFSGRYLPKWEAKGFERRVLWDLVKDGWLSEDVAWSSQAIREGKENWIYISQRTAKEIWRAVRGK